MKLWSLALLTGLLSAPLAGFTGTAQLLDEDSATRALAFLLRNADTVPLEGDVSEGERLTEILARELVRQDTVEEKSHSCIQGAGDQDRLISCAYRSSRSSAEGKSELIVEYTLSVEDDGTLSTLLSAKVGRGT